jgi:hypothetical protein
MDEERSLHALEDAEDIPVASAAFKMTTPDPFPVDDGPPPPRLPGRKRKAPTIRLEEWERVKPRISSLHFEQKLPLSKIMADLEVNFGFKAT